MKNNVAEKSTKKLFNFGDFSIILTFMSQIVLIYSAGLPRKTHVYIETPPEPSGNATFISFLLLTMGILFSVAGIVRKKRDNSFFMAIKAIIYQATIILLKLDFPFYKRYFSQGASFKNFINWKPAVSLVFFLCAILLVNALFEIISYLIIIKDKR